ncbi:MAG TPA: hypothetical protein VGR26_06930 [Acidimicrobiales bacterium]|nr:hypothetical protein [Acidimicrobiales bacterium]
MAEIGRERYGELSWLPEPTIATAGCHQLSLAGGGVLAGAVASDVSDLRRRLDAALVAGRCRGRLLQP